MSLSNTIVDDIEKNQSEDPLSKASGRTIENILGSTAEEPAAVSDNNKAFTWNNESEARRRVTGIFEKMLGYSARLSLKKRACILKEKCKGKLLKYFHSTRLDGLMTHKRKFLAKTNSPLALMKWFDPKLFEPVMYLLRLASQSQTEQTVDASSPRVPNLEDKKIYKLIDTLCQITNNKKITDKLKGIIKNQVELGVLHEKYIPKENKEKSAPALIVGCENLSSNFLSDSKFEGLKKERDNIRNTIKREYQSGYPPESCFQYFDERVHFGNYYIEEYVDRGTWGQVFKAKNSADGGLFALKFFDPSESAIKYMQAEPDKYYIDGDVNGKINLDAIWKAETLNNLGRGYTNLAFTKLEQVGDIKFLMIEWIPSFLSDRLKEAETPDKNGVTKNFALSEIIDIAEQMANGLSVLHKHDIVHRDLKPANIGYYKDCGKWRIKIADFGASTPLEDEIEDKFKQDKFKPNVRGGRGGRPQRAPEYYKSKETELTPASDMWALGTIIYRLAFGKEISEDIKELYNFEKGTKLDVAEIYKECSDEQLNEYISSVLRKRGINVDGVPGCAMEVIMSSLLNADPTRRSSADNLLETIDRFDRSKDEINSVDRLLGNKHILGQNKSYIKLLI